MDRPIDFSRLRTVPLDPRSRGVRTEQFGRCPDLDESLGRFLDGLPDLLAVRELRGLAAAVARARAAKCGVVWALGGHVVKSGVSPVVVEQIERGRITALALNGAAAIHDWEIAAAGATSEHVDSGLGDGAFGATEETGRELNTAAVVAAESDRGFGEVLGERIESARLPQRDRSVLAAAARRGVPATIHVALGCDVVHLHPTADGAAIGAASHFDFRRLVGIVGGLAGGVWINCGSAVQLPEVFLKAFSAARNLGHRLDGLTTADLDMQRHYRTERNVLERPTAACAGAAFRLTGHHEIQIPLLAAAIEQAVRRLDGGDDAGGGPPRGSA